MLCCMVVVILAGCKYIAPMTAVSGPEVEIQREETPQQPEARETITIEVVWPKGDVWP